MFDQLSSDTTFAEDYTQDGINATDVAKLDLVLQKIYKANEQNYKLNERKYSAT